MKAISIRQPWAWLILHGGKDIENRTWRTPFRGRVLVHAAKGMTQADYWAAVLFCQASASRPAPGVSFPTMDELAGLRGGVVGEVEIVDCVRESPSPWFTGPFGFVLRNARPLPFQPCKGALGFFEVPREGVKGAKG